jgi:hypothetical protein
MQKAKVARVVKEVARVCETYKMNLGIDAGSDEIHQIISIDKKPRLIKMGSQRSIKM